MTSARHTHHPLPTSPEPFDRKRRRAGEEALRVLPVPDENSRRYPEKDILRLARPVAVVPPPVETARTPELGCYMQVAQLLERLSGYLEG